MQFPLGILLVYSAEQQKSFPSLTDRGTFLDITKRPTKHLLLKLEGQGILFEQLYAAAQRETFRGWHVLLKFWQRLCFAEHRAQHFLLGIK